MKREIKSFSRRVGRKLRPGQKDLINDFLPTISLDLASKEFFDVESLFDRSIKGYELEIGFGSGEHMVARAIDSPQLGIIGCEPYLNGVAKAVSLIKSNNLSNLKIYSDDANHILDNVESTIFDRVLVLFPDPWPKKRHHNRRIINPTFLAKISRILKNEGKFIVATDHVEYARWILAELGENKAFTLEQHGDDLRRFPNGWNKSKYHLKAEAQGLSPFYFEFIHNYNIT
jgi:tRNA (guanine-N7-)-methyltransferase